VALISSRSYSSSPSVELELLSDSASLAFLFPFPFLPGVDRGVASDRLLSRFLGVLSLFLVLRLDSLSPRPRRFSSFRLVELRCRSGLLCLVLGLRPRDLDLDLDLALDLALDLDLDLDSDVDLPLVSDFDLDLDVDLVLDLDLGFLLARLLPFPGIFVGVF
jgi:hypothetical protein